MKYTKKDQEKWNKKFDTVQEAKTDFLNLKMEDVCDHEWLLAFAVSFLQYCK